MNIHNPQVLAATKKAPSAGARAVPTGFRDSLIRASRFTGRHNNTFPWIRHTYLVDGKLYASDNRCIIELDLHDQSFGSAQFSHDDVAVIKAMGNDPYLWEATDGEMRFSWNDGRWSSSNADTPWLELPNRCKQLLTAFWREGQELTSDLRASIVDRVSALKAEEAEKRRKEKTKAKEKTKRISRGRITHHEYLDTMLKLMTLADSYDSDSVPISFTFPNGRGLIVASSVYRLFE